MLANKTTSVALMTVVAKGNLQLIAQTDADMLLKSHLNLIPT